jgi:hypothetical protein
MSVTPDHLCPQVIFATPTLGHSFSAHFMKSLQETQWMLSAHGITSGCMVRPGDCFVDKARNKLVTDFLREFPATQNFFFLDDDIGWPPEKIVEFIQRPDPVVAGVYPKKSEDIDWPCTFALNGETGDLIESEGMILATMAPTGFMRIKRHVLERLAERASIFSDDAPGGERLDYHYIFECGRGGDGKFWGEDYTFCKKITAAGFHIWIDPNIVFKHQGVRTWEDRIFDHLPTFRARAKAVAEGRLDPETGEIMAPADLASAKIGKMWTRRTLSSADILERPAERSEFADLDAEFWPLYDRCHEETMTPIERLFDLYKTVEYIVRDRIPGAIAECGVWRGGSMMMIADALTKFGDTSRTLQLFDTFEGLPYPDDKVDIDIFDNPATKQWRPEMAKGPLDVVTANMALTGYPGVEYHKGMVEDTLAKEALEQYALVRLDTDWYSSTKVELEVLWPRIAPGGVLIIDDFGHWQGARMAVDEFFADKPVRMVRVDYSCRVIQKGLDRPVALAEAAE